MPRDLMDSLKAEPRENQYSDRYDNRYTPDHTSIEMGQMGRRPPASSEFTEKIKAIYHGISKVNAKINEVKQAHEEALNTTGEFRLSQCTARRDDQIAKTQAMISTVKQEMRELQALKNKYVKSSSIDRSLKAIFQSKYHKVCEDVKAMMEGYSNVAKKYSSQYREKLKTQYRIANPSATEEEIDDAVYNDNAHQAFATAVSNSSKVQSATRVLSNVKQRHDDVKKIEKTIEELAAMIFEMAQMVDEQQEAIDHIEDAIEESSAQVEEGHKAIGQAIVYRKKSRKRAWIFILLAVILLVVIGVVLYFKLR
ncbi:hypothetical protein EV183_005563 [Coemansia sp. RSA 2336]|nr:hypothetical protein EV183_005563 [Coemansia sp. RSA 2336]